MIEIGQGSARSMKQTMASMGANILLVMPGTASSGGVSFGGGSGMTLTPQDSDAICAAVPALCRRRADRAGATARLFTATATGSRCKCTGRTPDFLKVRDWEEYGRRSHLHRSRRAQRRRRLRARSNGGDESVRRRIARRQGHSDAKRLVPRRRRAQPKRGQHDWHGPRRFRARPVDDDQVPRQRLDARQRESKRLAPRPPPIRARRQLSTRSIKLYPSSTAIALSAACRRPQRPTLRSRCGSPMSIRSWRKPGRAEEMPRRSSEITTLLHERHHIRLGESDDFKIRDMTEISNALFQRHDDHDDLPA